MISDCISRVANLSSGKLYLAPGPGPGPRSDRGPDEAVADAQQQLGRLTSDLALLERDKDALQLLDQVLSEAAQAAEAHYLAPVTRHLLPYLDELLGQAEL